MSSSVHVMLVIPAKTAAPALPLSSSDFRKSSLWFSSAHVIIAEDSRLLQGTLASWDPVPEPEGEIKAQGTCLALAVAQNSLGHL